VTTNDGDQPQEISPQPGPFTVNIELISSTVGVLVVLTIKTHSGQTIIFMTPEQAAGIAGMIGERAAIAGKGLLLPPGTVMPSPEQPEAN
jgi:hypothetical protein